MESLLSKYQLEALKELIQLELLRRGFTAQIVKIDEVEVRGRRFVAFETEKFQTVPVLFKDIIVNQFNSSLKKEVFTRENGTQYEMIKVYISIHVSYNHFDGGSNGCKLFSIECQMADSDDRYEAERIYKLKIKS